MVTTVKKKEQKQVSLEDKLNEAFFIDKVVEADVYIIALTERDPIAIRKASLETARKLVESNIIKEYKDDFGIPYFGIELEKHYGLNNRETMQLQTGLSGKTLADYFELRADLIELGHKEDEVDQILSNPKEYGKLTHDQKVRAMNILKQAQSNQDKVITDITGVISARLIPDWSVEDTNYLPDRILKEFSTFIECERNQWVGHDSESPKLPAASTTTDVEQGS